jgi:hypothetical protein
VRTLRWASVLAAVSVVAAVAPASAAVQTRYDWVASSPYESCSIHGAAVVHRVPFQVTTAYEVVARTDLVSGCTGRGSAPVVGLYLTCAGTDAAGNEVWNKTTWENTPYGNAYGEIYRTGSVVVEWPAPVSVVAVRCTGRHIAATVTAKDIPIFTKQDHLQT